MSEVRAAPTRRALVTGLTGFTGRYLAECLAAEGWEVHGTTQEPVVSMQRVHSVDLLDARALRAVVEAVDPTEVVHLAALAFVAHGDAEALYRTNIVGTRNLLQALVGAPQLRRVLLASSANVYGNAETSPIREDTPPKPSNDYAVSKLAMEHMAALWLDRLPITIVRPFNYTGVGQHEQFLVPKIVAAFHRRQLVLELGNLDVERDLSDVRDVVAAYRALLDAPAGGLFNVCSGRAVALRAIVESAERITGHHVDVQVNPAFVRPNEVHRLCGDPSRLATACGRWLPRPFADTLAWMLAR